MTGRKLAVQTYGHVWRASAREALMRLADRGYNRFEVMVTWPHLWPEHLSAGERDAMARMLASRDLRIEMLNPPSLDLNPVSPAAEMRAYTIAHFRRVIELAGDWGAPFVQFVPGRVHPLLPAPAPLVQEWLDAALETLDREAERHGVRILVENVPSACLPRSEDLAAALARIGNPRLGVSFDAANATFAGEDAAEALRRLAPLTGLIHLADTARDRWRHGPVGSGIVPFGAIAAALDETGIAPVSVLAIISDQPDTDIAESHVRLHRLGWEAPPSPDGRQAAVA